MWREQKRKTQPKKKKLWKWKFQHKNKNMENQNNMSPPKDKNPIVMATNKNDMKELTKSSREWF